MFCPKCGKKIEGTPDICPLCNENISEDSQLMKNGGVPGPKIPKKPLKTGILRPIISLVLAVVFLVGSVFGTVFTNINVTKASDKTTESKVVSSTPVAEEPQYDVDRILKPPVDTSVISNLVPDSDGAANAREEIAVVEFAVAAAEAEVAAQYPEITRDTADYYLDKVADIAYDLYWDDLIYDYEINKNCVIFELNGGGYYIYAPTVPGIDAGVSAEVKVSTYQPFVGSGHYNHPGYEKYASYPEDAAVMISNTFDTYTFRNDGSSTDDNHDDAEVDHIKTSQFGAYGVVLWHGHGSYSYEHGSLMALGVKRTDDLDAKFYSLFKEGKLLWSKDTYVVGADFIEYCLPDNSLEHTVLYLGTCLSGYTDELAYALLAKGAEAVYATSESIDTGYNASMIYSISEGLCQKNPDGSYYDVTEALEYAKNINGAYDNNGGYTAEVLLFTNNPTYSLDWYQDHVICDKDVVLLLDVSGSMDGEPLDETKKAAVEFANTVLDESARVSLVTYDSDVEVLNEFSVRDSLLISNINSLYTGDMTDLDAGLQKAEQLLGTSKANKKIIVLMSDGYPNEGRIGNELTEYAKTIKNQVIDIYTLGFFHKLSGDEKTNAQKLMNSIASEGYHYEVSKAEDLVHFFNDIAANISGQKYIYIEIACPVDVKVSKDGEELNSDEDNIQTHASFGTLSFVQTDDSDEDDLSEQKKILRLKDGAEYDIEIEGNGRGSMDYTVRYMDENGKYSDKREFSNIKITSSTVVETVASSMRDSTTLSVDEDGDGNFESVYEAKANQSGKKVDNTVNTLFKYAIYVCIVWLVVSLVFLVLRIRNRKIAAQEQFLQIKEPAV